MLRLIVIEINCIISQCHRNRDEIIFCKQNWQLNETHYQWPCHSYKMVWRKSWYGNMIRNTDKSHEKEEFSWTFNTIMEKENSFSFSWKNTVLSFSSLSSFFSLNAAFYNFVFSWFCFRNLIRRHQSFNLFKIYWSKVTDSLIRII